MDSPEGVIELLASESFDLVVFSDSKAKTNHISETIQKYLRYVKALFTNCPATVYSVQYLMLWCVSIHSKQSHGTESGYRGYPLLGQCR